MSETYQGASAPAETVSPPKRPSAPRPEIWFKRKIGLRTALRDAWRSRELIVTLAERDLRVRYKQAYLGIAWALFTPVMLMLVFSLVFTRFTKIATPPSVPYPLFAFLGLIPWTFFSAAVLGGGMSLVTNMQVLNKVYCPREVFPIAAIVVGAVDAIVSVLVLGVLFIVFGFAPKLETLYFPVLLPALVSFTLGITIGISALLVYLRDLRHALPLLIQFALFATPVAYGARAIANTNTKLLVYSALNPLAPVIDGLRRTVLLGLPPKWETLAVGTATSFAVLCCGYWVLKRLETGIADIA